ncbi:hypothetical protein [Myxosarcina sp. GI1(2024)]
MVILLRREGELRDWIFTRNPRYEDKLIHIEPSWAYWLKLSPGLTKIDGIFCRPKYQPCEWFDMTEQVKPVSFEVAGFKDELYY